MGKSCSEVIFTSNVIRERKEILMAKKPTDISLKLEIFRNIRLPFASSHTKPLLCFK